MSDLLKRSAEIFREEGALALAKKSLRVFYVRCCSLFIRYYSPYSRYCFLSKISNVRRSYGLERLIDFAYTECCGLIKPHQVRYEILKLLTILDEIKPECILEIGTANGGTLFFFSRIASEHACIISIDLPGGRFGGGYPEWKMPLYKSLASQKQQIHLIRENSHGDTTLERVKAILNGKMVDFLFIDGDHTYEGISKDFYMYGTLVKKNGMIAFHDIVPHPPKSGCEVSRFWNQIRSKYEYAEIVEDYNQKWAGIGLIRM